MTASEKKSGDTLYIVIPAYNEQDNIEDVVKDWHPIVEKYGSDKSKLVIINDGSKDNTYRNLKKTTHVLRQSIKRIVVTAVLYFLAINTPWIMVLTIFFRLTLTVKHFHQSLMIFGNFVKIMTVSLATVLSEKMVSLVFLLHVHCAALLKCVLESGSLMPIRHTV